MLRTFRLLWRLLAIARTLARHDALAPLEQLGVTPLAVRLAGLVSRRSAEGRPGQKLAAALTELGPSFIKLGQFLSTRADLLGEEIAADLSELQDSLAPFDPAEARRTIETELGGSIESLFLHFEEQPISAASIAQVHLATIRTPAQTPSEPDAIDARSLEDRPLEDGPLENAEEAEPVTREVAVKVLRPGIEKAFERDLELFYALAGIALRSQPGLQRFRLREVVATFEKTVRLEMDLRMEAAAASELAANFAGDPTYRIPAIDWERSGRRVLTQEKVSGIPLDDREGLLAAGHDLQAVLTRAAEIFFKQVFRDGFFHGDQHPGNMWVDEDGAIVAVDFGIMGRLDLGSRCYLADMLMTTLQRDYRALAQVHAEAGYLPADADLETFAQALRSVCEPIFGRPLSRISFARLLAQLFALTEAFAMPVQPQLLLLQKNMLMAEGVSRRLDPDLNIWTLAQPLIVEWMRANRGPEARLRDTAKEVAGTLERLPKLLRTVELAAERLAEEAPESSGSGARGVGFATAWTVLPWALAAGLLALLLFR